MSDGQSTQFKRVNYDPFRIGSVQMVVPSTEAQKEMWASIKMDESATLCYNESIEILFKGYVDYKSINQAYQELLKRHDALRSVFSSDGKKVFIKEYFSQDVRFVDLSGKANPQSDYQTIKKEEVLQKYDLEFGPLVRAILIKKSSDEYVFILSTHHIVCDGWSYAVLFHDLSFYYNKYKEGMSAELETPYQFSEFAIDLLREGDNKEHRAYWQNQFRRPVKSGVFPTDFKRGAFRTFKSTRIDVELEKELVVALKKVSSQNGSSLYGSLITLFNVFLSKLTKQKDVVVGLSSATQPAIDQNELVGHMVNLLPLRTIVEENKTLKEYLKDVRSKMLDAFDHQFYTYGTLVKELNNIERNYSELPLLNVVFNIDQQAPDQGLKFNNLKAFYRTIPREFENFDMFINAASCNDQLVLECQFNESILKRETVVSWLKSYVELLKIFTQNVNVPIATLLQTDIYIPHPQMGAIEPPKEDRIIHRDLEVEKRVKALWAEVLFNDNIDEKDNFFSIGGHSLLAIELASLIEKEFSCAFAMKDIFENPNIVMMAARLAGPKETQEEKAILPAIEVKHLTSEKVSFSQMQIWFLEEMFSRTTMHNLPAAIRVKSKLNISALEQALNTLMLRHEAFRTFFVLEGGVPVQKVHSDNQLKIKLEVVDTTESNLHSRLNKEADYVFDKSKAPLFKSKVFKISENEFVIFFLVHHAIWDGWSFDIFFEELNIAYTAFNSNTIPVFAQDVKLSYLDYTHWLNAQLNEKKLDNELRYWEEKLKKPLPVMELPTDFQRPPEMSHIGQTVPFTLSNELAESVKSYAKAQGTSLFNVFLTAFKITLSRYSKESGNFDDVIVGAPVRGRVHPEVMNTIGYFVNSIALRTTIDHDKSFTHNLNEVSKTCAEAFANQLIPFQIVLNKTNTTRDRSRSPVFQSFFSYQNVNNRSAKLGGEKYQQVNVDKASTHTDLDLWIKANDSKIEGAFEFREDLFLPITIERFLESFLFLLENLNSISSVSLNNTSFLPLKHKRLLQDWNNTELAIDERPFVQVFSELAKTQPNALAVLSGKDKLSYQELDKLSNRMANTLSSFGVKSGDLIGISLSRDINLLPALLGILKLGAGYVPLDPSFPDDRLFYMIENSKLDTLITEEDYFKRFQHVEKKIEVKKALQNNAYDELLIKAHLSSSSVAYVIYTSGSTGLPKGVSIAQSSVSNFLQSMKSKNISEAKDCLLAVTTLSFDISVLELFLPLISGGSLYLANSREVIDGNVLNNIIEAHHINLMQATPTTWRLLLAAGFKGREDFKALCGGEPFPKDLANKLIPLCKEVWNMYGPTETTVWSTMKKLVLNENVTIGRPIGNTTIYILDENLKTVPIGVKGRLFIGGKGVSLGYFNRDDLTRERFIQNPNNRNEIIYDTGDLAKFNNQGELVCLGRNDGQVKVRGYRIELGEIEAQLQKIPNVNESAVKVLDYKAGDQRIVAFYSTHDSNVLDEKQVRSLLAKNLSGYMIPSHYVFMKEIPKTLNGKIDKKSLPNVFANEKVTELEQRPAENKTELKGQLYQMIKDVLKIDSINDQDNFFDVGGNSLLAVELFSKMAEKFNVNLQLSILIEARDFAGFYQAISDKISPSKTNTTSINLIPSVDQVFKSLVAISNRGDKNPLYCFHAVGGNILNYVSIVPAMKSQRPLLAFQSVGLDGETEPHTSIEEMALVYYRELKLAQPEGPYLLAGGSMGGLIALEVARRIIESGEKIDKIIMFDTFGPNLNLKSYSSKKKVPLHKRIVQSLRYRTKAKLYFFMVKAYRRLGLKIPLSVLLFDIEQRNYKAIWSYRPKSYDGDIHLIRSKVTKEGWYSDPQMGWGGIINGEIKTIEINSTHESFIESAELVKVLSKIV